MDPYFKLRPPDSTPADEICSCQGSPPIKLMCALSYNPIHCMNCNLEVAPESLRLAEKLTEWVAFWRACYGAIARLWLESREYEGWAKQQLADIASPMNMRGRELQSELSNVRRCYYWYFQDESAEDYEPISRCPVCGGQVRAYDSGIFKQVVCGACMIVAAGE